VQVELPDELFMIATIIKLPLALLKEKEPEESAPELLKEIAETGTL
jgi:hypothetical protein